MNCAGIIKLFFIIGNARVAQKDSCDGILDYIAGANILNFASVFYFLLILLICVFTVESETFISALISFNGRFSMKRI